jgi:hypothetical protein
MRWKISHHHHGHDPRQVDLLAAVALLIAIVAACSFIAIFTASTPSDTALIEPSQNVRW